MTRHSVITGGLLVALAVGACGRETPTDTGGGGELGMVSLAITNAPADATCIRLTVTGSRTVVRTFDVSPGDSTVFLVKGLPVGNDSFLGEAFASSCAALTAASVATWISDPLPVTLTAGVIVSVTLPLRRNGAANVGIDFVDEADGGAAGGAGGAGMGGAGGAGGSAMVCVPGSNACSADGVFSTTCNSAGTGNSAFTNCQAVFGTPCNPATGTCQVCVPGSNACSADGVFSTTCNSAGTGNSAFVNCPAVFGVPCNPASGTCQVCIPNTSACSADGAVSTTCNSAGTGNSAFTNCQAVFGHPCNPATGTCQVCIPNSNACSADGLTSTTCNSAGTGNSAFTNCQAVFGHPCNPATGTCN